MPGTGSLCSLSVSLMIRFGSGADIVAVAYGMVDIALLGQLSTLQLGKTDGADSADGADSVVSLGIQSTSSNIFG
jgi:hypothetical protein